MALGIKHFSQPDSSGMNAHKLKGSFSNAILNIPLLGKNLSKYGGWGQQM